MAGGVGARATWPGLREGGAEVEGAVRVEGKAAGGVEAEAGARAGLPECLLGVCDKVCSCGWGCCCWWRWCWSDRAPSTSSWALRQLTALKKEVVEVVASPRFIPRLVPCMAPWL